MIRKLFCQLVLILAFTQLAQAQYSETISTARPGVSIGPSTVGKNILQFQQGLEYALADTEADIALAGVEDSRRIENRLSFINITRYGISRKFELSAVVAYGGSESYLVNADGKRYRTLNERNNDVRLLDIGGRYNLRESTSGGPAIGVQARVGLEPSISGTGSPELKLITSASQRFGANHSLTANLGYTGRDYTADLLLYTLKYSLSIGERMALMVENYGHFAFGGDAHGSDFNSFFDVGVSCLLTDDILLDLQSGFSNNKIGNTGRKSSEWFIGGGISWRINFNDEG